MGQTRNDTGKLEALSNTADLDGNGNDLKSLTDRQDLYIGWSCGQNYPPLGTNYCAKACFRIQWTKRVYHGRLKRDIDFAPFKNLR